MKLHIIFYFQQKKIRTFFTKWLHYPNENEYNLPISSQSNVAEDPNKILHIHKRLSLIDYIYVLNYILRNIDIIRFILLTWSADADIKNPVIVRNNLIHQTPEVGQQCQFIFLY